jgi:tRNA (uracil-5-)-methyltransferase
MVGGLPAAEEGSNSLYELESVRGADFFPQTYHVEAIAMLRKKKKVSVSENVSDEKVSDEELPEAQAV